MRALTFDPHAADSARLDDVDEPPIEDGSVLVEALALGVCGDRPGPRGRASRLPHAGTRGA